MVPLAVHKVKSTFEFSFSDTFSLSKNCHYFDFIYISNWKMFLLHSYLIRNSWFSAGRTILTVVISCSDQISYLKIKERKLIICKKTNHVYFSIPKMISYALGLRKSEEQIFAIFHANFAVMQIASATHSANFNEKVHKPQSKSYSRIGANMQLIFIHILWIWIVLSLYYKF